MLEQITGVTIESLFQERIGGRSSSPTRRVVTIVALTKRDEPRAARETTSGRIWNALARAYDRHDN